MSESLSPSLPGFEAVSRRYDKKFHMVSARVLPGEYYVTKNNEIIETILGSCISACVRDPYAGIGGINHFMLPFNETGAWGGTDVSAATRYGNFAMEHLVNDLLRHGAAKNSLEIKLFGGGKVLKAMTDIGRKNINFVQNYLKTEGYRAMTTDLGGEVSRKIIYFPMTGKVLVKHLERDYNAKVEQEEKQYLNSLQQEDVGGEIDLF